VDFSRRDFQALQPIRPAIVTWNFWVNRLARDPAAVGRTLVDDAGKGIRVAGILPEGFVFPFPAGETFAPEALTPRVESTPRSTTGSRIVLIRLGPGMEPADAEGRLTAVATRWAAEHPAAPRAGDSERNAIIRGPYDRVGLVPIRPALTADLGAKAWTVFGAAAALMLLACLNAAAWRLRACAIDGAMLRCAAHSARGSSIWSACRPLSTA
jgi:hypothetical protein